MEALLNRALQMELVLDSLISLDLELGVRSCLEEAMDYN